MTWWQNLIFSFFAGLSMSSVVGYVLGRVHQRSKRRALDNLAVTFGVEIDGLRQRYDDLQKAIRNASDLDEVKAFLHAGFVREMQEVRALEAPRLEIVAPPRRKRKRLS